MLSEARLRPPDDRAYSFCYRYAIAPRKGSVFEWRQGRTRASFDWTDLGSFAGEKKLQQVWLALKRGGGTAAASVAAGSPFAIKLEVRPPHGREPVWGGLVKGIFDGVVCAFQAHSEMSVLPDVAARLATVLPASAEEIAAHLVGQRMAVLSAVPRLVAPYRRGVKSDPTDHSCVAGELLAVEPIDQGWAFRGEIVEVSR